MRIVVLIILSLFLNIIVLGIVRSFFKEVLRYWTKPLALLLLVPPFGFVMFGLILVFGFVAIIVHILEWFRDIIWETDYFD